MIFFYISLATLTSLTCLLILWPIMANHTLSRRKKLGFSAFSTGFILLVGVGLYYSLGVPVIVQFTG
jgi:hypothetical protein